jgi:hypothetical protein
VLQQALAQVACSDANNRIFAGVIGGSAPEQFHPDDTFFQGIKLPGESLLHDVAEELAAAMTSSEGSAFNNLSKMMPESCGILF